MKNFIKKYFNYLSFFYSYLRRRIFYLVILSSLVGIFDGLGIAMFIPLLQFVSGDDNVKSSESMGNLSFLIDGLRELDIQLTLNWVLFLMLLLFLIKGIFKFYESYYRVSLRAFFMKKLRIKLINGLTALDYYYFTGLNAGRIQNTLTGETGRISAAFHSYFSVVQQSILLSVYMALALITNLQFAVLVIIGAIFSNFIFRLIFRLTKRLSLYFTTKNHQFQSLIIQKVEFFKYLKSTNTINQFSRKLLKSVSELEHIQKNMGFYNSILIGSREVVVITIVVLVIIFQVNFLGGALSTIILSLLFFYRGLNSLMSIQNYWNQFLNVSGSIEHLKDFEIDLKNGKEINRDISFKGFNNSLTIKNLNFKYNKSLVLQNINLTIKKNSTVAFIGESGSGKTTLANLIAGLLKSPEGEILVDNIPLTSINLNEYRSRIGYITQESVVFNDNIYNNVTFWEEPTEQTMEKFNIAVEKAHLETVIKNLPNKEQTYLGDRGVLFSGGQKQRLSIAREIFRDSQILILDEATSALDSETEKVIKDNIDHLKGQYTIIIIAHRLSTIRNVDKIVLLNNGKVEAVGSFDELLKKSNQFQQMVDLQDI